MSSFKALSANMLSLTLHTSRTLLKLKPHQRYLLHPSHHHIESTATFNSFLREKLKTLPEEHYSSLCKHWGALGKDASKWIPDLLHTKCYHQFSQHHLSLCAQIYPNMNELRNQGIMDKVESKGLLCVSSNCLQVRHKSKKKQTDITESDSESDKEDDALEEDDFQAPAQFKVMKIHTASTRADAIISTALDVARNRVEENFFGRGLLLNGNKLLKKAAKMDEGDYVDLVLEKAEDQLKVKRVKLLKIYPQKTKTEKYLVKVRVWKSPFTLARSEKRL